MYVCVRMVVCLSMYVFGFILVTSSQKKNNFDTIQFYFQKQVRLSELCFLKVSDLGLRVITRIVTWLLQPASGFWSSWAAGQWIP